MCAHVNFMFPFVPQNQLRRVDLCGVLLWRLQISRSLGWCGWLPCFCSQVMVCSCSAYRSAFLLQEYEFDLEVTPADAEGGDAEAMEEA